MLRLEYNGYYLFNNGYKYVVSDINNWKYIS
jgi:hypothetical protein